MKTIDALNIVLVQHELLMAIKQSAVDVNELLERFTSTAIKALNTPAIHIILKSNKDYDSINKTLSYPNVSESGYHVLDNTFSHIPKATEFLDCIPSNSVYSYVYSIKDVGYIIFERYKKRLPQNLDRALLPIIEKIGHACISCYRYQQMIKNNQTNKIAEIQLRIEKNKLQTTLDAIPNGLITLNRELEILYMNRNATAFFRFSRLKCKDQDIRKNITLYDIEEKKDITDIFFEYLQIKGSWNNVMPLIVKASTGTELTVEINARSIINDNNDISSYVLVIKDVSHTIKIENELKWQATHDPLTHLLNRRGFESHLQRLIYRDSDYNHVLLYLDLDRFKIVNDVCGHQAGDFLLQQISEVISNDIRATDVLARLGGDEFSIILHDCNLDFALTLAERIKQSIAKFHFSWKKNLFNVGVSIGVTNIDKLSNDVDKIMCRADMACYAAKENGRNQVYLADIDKDSGVTEKITNTNFVSLVNSAVEKNRLILYGQVIQPLSTSDDKPHVEVLLRMLDEGRVVPPDAFLPIAERYGKIRDIDRWVIKNVIQHLKVNTDYQININLSGVTLSDTTALDEIINLMETNPEEAQQICFEITETAAITNLDRCVSFIKQLQEFGCTFALDDFGSGLSSFSYLKHLPVKYLKIDGSFIKDICSNKTDEIVVTSIHKTAKALNIKTVAEYVSNDDIYNLVKKIGIDFVQGYKIGKPQELATIKPMLEETV